jgi:hypothetical protein
MNGTLDNVKDRIKAQFPFTYHKLRGKVPLAGETLSSGDLQGPPRELFQSEQHFNTLRYVVIVNRTPVLWNGAFGWIMPNKRWLNISKDDYLFLSEIFWELTDNGLRDPYNSASH